MRGILYGVGVGPGDPELMTLKAVRMIRENEVIAVPGAEAKETVWHQVVVQAECQPWGTTSSFLIIPNSP